jgi:hypothetical protein
MITIRDCLVLTIHDLNNGCPSLVPLPLTVLDHSWNNKGLFSNYSTIYPSRANPPPLFLLTTTLSKSIWTVRYSNRLTFPSDWTTNWTLDAGEHHTQELALTSPSFAPPRNLPLPPLKLLHIKKQNCAWETERRWSLLGGVEVRIPSPNAHYLQTK